MTLKRLFSLMVLTMLYCLALVGVAHASTLGNLMEVLEEDKHKAIYNMDLNAPFTKESSGYEENINVETGDLTLTRTEFNLPGKNSFDLLVQTKYESSGAKLFDENVQATWTGQTDGQYNSFGGTIVAYYEVFDSDELWLRSDWRQYEPFETIAGGIVYGSEIWIFSGYLFRESNPGHIIAADDTGNIHYSSTPAEKSDFLKTRYSLGEGWRFNLPAVEISEISSAIKFLHLDDGRVFMVNSENDSGLDKYPLKDLIFEEHAGYNNGTESSAFRLKCKDGRETYFAGDGRVIGDRDRFLNEIKYFYMTDIQGRKILSGITDSAGRQVSISYQGDNIVISTGDRKVTYEKEAITGYAGKFYLSRITDPAGRQLNFDYSLSDAQFWVYDNSTKTGVNKYANLGTVAYPTGANTQYQWLQSTKSLGNPGKMQYYKTAKRADNVDGAEINTLTYMYNKEPDGYPDYRATPELPETYSYSTIVTDQSGLATEYRYDNRHLNTRTTLTAAGIFNRIDVSYDSDTKLPTKTVTAIQNNQGEVIETHRATKYDIYGDLLLESSPCDASDPMYSERAIEYTYDQTYHIPVSKKLKKDLDTTQEWQWKLTCDKKSIAEETVLENGAICQKNVFTYDEYGNKLSETRQGGDGMPVTTRYEYDPVYKGVHLTKKTVLDVIDADGKAVDIPEEYTYDINGGWLRTSTDGNHNTTIFKYDLLGRPVDETLPTEEKRTYEYNDADNTIVATDERGYAKTYQFDGIGRLQKVFDNTTGITLAAYKYDQTGRKAKSIDGNGSYWSYQYDPLGRLTKKERCSNGGHVVASTTVTYDDAYTFSRLDDDTGKLKRFQRVTVTNDGDGSTLPVSQTYYFDETGQLVIEGKLTGQGEQFSRYTLDYLGNRVNVEDFLGNVIGYKYDYAGHVTEERRQGGDTYRYTYNALGKQVSRTDPKGNTTLYQVDALGRMVMQVAPFDHAGTSVSKWYYDANGNQTRLVMPTGNSTEFYYDQRNRLVRVVTHPDVATTNIAKYAYDAGGNLSEVITGLSSEDDPQYSKETYFYDSLGRRVKARDPLGNETTTEYDNNGNAIRVVDQNGTETTYTYDQMDRLLSRKAGKDGKLDQTTFAYNFTGSRSSMIDLTGESIYRYDEMGYLVHEKNPEGIEKRQTFNAQGLRTSFELLRNGRSELKLDYRYDNQNQLAEVNHNGERVTYEYDANGNLVKTVNQATNLAEILYYNEANLPVAQEILSGQDKLYVYNFDYDLAGNISKITGPDGITSYTYDGLNRLSHAEYPDGKKVDYQFDDLGNRSKQVEIYDSKAYGSESVVQETSYAYDQANRLLLTETNLGQSKVVNRFDYDKNGNQLTKEEWEYWENNLVNTNAWQYHYDALNQLDEVATPSGERYRYAYNGDGLRVKKTRDENSLTYAYDGQNIVMEARNTGPDVAVTIRGKRIISRITPDGPTYFTHSMRGDVLALYSPGHEESSKYEYDAFGVGIAGTASKKADQFDLEVNYFRYNGEQFDSETGYYYQRARYYDPVIGRFTSKDSYQGDLTNPLSMNLYTYCINNPINYVDPTGHSYMWAKALYENKSYDELHWIYQILIDQIKNEDTIQNGNYSAMQKIISKDQLSQFYDDFKIINELLIIKGDYSSEYKECAQQTLNNLVQEEIDQSVNIVTNIYGGKGNSSNWSGKAEKYVPNPYGKIGGPAHQGKIQEIAQELQQQGYDVRFEQYVKTTGGNKSARYGDILVSNPETGEQWLVQVGKQTQAGNPISRESKAIQDLINAGWKVQFEPY